MASKFVIEGIDDFREQLRNLPEHLRREASNIATGEANAAAVEVRTKYGQHRHSGKLQDSVEVVETKNAGQFGVGLTVVANQWYAILLEWGVEAERHTAMNWDRGKMPAQHLFVPIMQKRRKVMERSLKRLLEDQGFEVVDHGG
jgi:HK97 gp10 family phage protein